LILVKLSKVEKCQSNHKWKQIFISPNIVLILTNILECQLQL